MRAAFRPFVRLLALLALLLAAPLSAVPALWVVKGPAGEVALYGTIHALPRGTAWLTQAAGQRLDAAGSLAIEAVPPADPAALTPLVTELGMRLAPRPLAQRIAPRLRPRLAATAQTLGLALPTLNGMESWLAALTIGQAQLRRAGYAAADGVEPALIDRARRGAKPVVGIETFEQQLRLLASLPEPDQVAMLETTIAEGVDPAAEARALVEAWQAGDSDRIASDFAREASGSPTLRRVLLADRNRRWADWVAGVVRRPGRVFLAVGAVHLGGPDGLVALLRQKGLTVERVE